MSNLEALNEAIALIEGLSEQQAMQDDWYVDRLAALKKHRDEVKIINNFYNKINAPDLQEL